ncbi:H-type small acid-soluble spore protein [Bacillus suaedae]|uniref:Small, acid-soluble spore protein H n=1 Tax=Halalkalibacter suaedae TaxID=2822140 RepID=A0A941APT2_9BACI|nr:H-type small acid-soluble spore protein [Bacillus suaedae]MBP3950443.1 H-type small acid-soluble spore protein [Bacillus suaedae]
MNLLRAQEIAQSPVMANVTYLDKQVYIQHVIEHSETARIFPLDEPQNELEVNLDNLIEH